MSQLTVNVKYMFDIHEPGSVPGSTIPVPGGAVPDGAVPGAVPVPLERLEAQICELAGHLAAATCRFLVLLADFDARRGWASWDMSSCAAWLSWKCQMSSGAAREHVRVARALRDLPVLRAEFAAARLSYAKVRALTRIATADTEEGLAEIAGPMTGNQLERFARAHRQVTSAGDAAARVRRRLAWRFEDDGSLAGTFRLPPLAGAVLLKALRAAAGDLQHPRHDQDAGVSAETPAPAPRAPGDPADPARCHVQDGPALSASTAQMLGCTAALSLDAARPRRRRSWTWGGAGAARTPRCARRPGNGTRAGAGSPAASPAGSTCTTSGTGATAAAPSWATWSASASTTTCWCTSAGYLIAAPPGGAFAFYRPDGTALPPSPALPQPDGTIEDCHDADITPETIIPPWYGERLDLDEAIYICLANARTPRERQDQRDQADDPEPVPAQQMGGRTIRLDPVPQRTHGRLSAGQSAGSLAGAADGCRVGIRRVKNSARPGDGQPGAHRRTASAIRRVSAKMMSTTTTSPANTHRQEA